MELTIFPQEIIFHIIQDIPISNIIFFGSTNKYFNNIIKSEILWKYLFDLDYGNKPKIFFVNYKKSYEIYHICLKNIDTIIEKLVWISENNLNNIFKKLVDINHKFLSIPENLNQLILNILNNIDSIKYILLKYNYNNIQLFIIACSKGYYEAVQYFIQNKIDIDFMFNGSSHHYEIVSYPKILNLLLENGGKKYINILKDNISLLYFAVKDNSESVEILLKNGADPNIGNKCLLLYAIQLKRSYTVDLLLKYGANFPLIDNEHISSNLIYSIRNDHIDIFKFCLDKKNYNLSEFIHDGRSLLSLACIYRRIEMVKLLLSKNIQINSRNFKNSPIGIAFLSNNQDLIQILSDYYKNNLNTPY